MKIRFDKEADAIYITLMDGKWSSNKKMDDLTIFDLDKDDQLLGIELLNVSKRIPQSSLREIKVENINVV